eukprot:jgi/Mesen1/4079/ME000213S03103
MCLGKSQPTIIVEKKIKRLRLLLAADKYGIETCVQACLEYLNETLPRAPEEDVVEIAKHLFLIQHVNNSTSVLENAKARLVAMLRGVVPKFSFGGPGASAAG